MLSMYILESLHHLFCLALSFSEREELFQPMEDANPDDMVVDDFAVGDTSFPPGEEAFLQSHAGGEAILHEILEGMSSRFIVLRRSIYFLFFIPEAEKLLTCEPARTACKSALMLGGDNFPS